MNNFTQTTSFIWNVADTLRNKYLESEYRDVILPMVVIRRFDCILEPTKKNVLDKYNSLKTKIKNIDPVLNNITNVNFNNTSQFTMSTLLNDSTHIKANFTNYINGFSKNIREIIENYDFTKQIEKLEKKNILYAIIKHFSEVDLHPDVISNEQMGYIFENLLRRFSENESAGQHYTPREVIQLMVNVLLGGSEEDLVRDGLITTVYDCCSGTGHMLTAAEEHIKKLNKTAQVELFGQEVHDKTYAICKSDMIIKGQNAENIKLGNTLNDDKLPDKKFRIMMTNPPFGLSWSDEANYVKKEHSSQGYNGRFGPGTPRTSDGSLLFLMHLISKMYDDDKGSRIGIVFNGSPLFNGDAGSGESEIRKYILENDLLEGIIALPDNMFYNTGISTYVWILSNRKNSNPRNGNVRTNKVQFVDAREKYVKMRKNLGYKNKEITKNLINEITQLYWDFEENELVKIFNNEDFGYKQITLEILQKVEGKLSDSVLEKLKEKKNFQKEDERIQVEILTYLKDLNIENYLSKNNFKSYLKKKFPKVSAGLLNDIVKCSLENDTENIPLTEDVDTYLQNEVDPFVECYFIDDKTMKIGYEIPFTRYFYKYEPPKPFNEVWNEVKVLEKQLQELMEEV